MARATPSRGRSPPRRQLACRRQASLIGSWTGTKPEGSSSAPNILGSCARTHSAPSPHASPVTSPADGSGTIRSVVLPSGVRMPRQMAPSEVRRKVGSPAPRRCVDRILPTGHGQSGRQTRTSGPAWAGICADYDAVAKGRPTSRCRWLAPTECPHAAGSTRRRLDPGRLHPLAVGQAGADRRSVAGGGGCRRRGDRRRGVVPLRHAAPAPHRPGLAVARGAAGAGHRTIRRAGRGRRDVGGDQRPVRRRFDGCSPRSGDHPVRPPDRGRAGVPAQPGHRQRPPGRTRLGDARCHRGRGRPRPQVRTPRGHVQRADRTHRPRSPDRGRHRARGLQPARRQAGPADARRHRSRRRRRCRQGRGTVRRRHQAGRHPDPGAQARRRGGGVHAQPRGDRCPAPRGRRRPPGRCRPPT